MFLMTGEGNGGMVAQSLEALNLKLETQNLELISRAGSGFTLHASSSMT
jgi:hypothetical protein